MYDESGHGTGAFSPQNSPALKRRAFSSLASSFSSFDSVNMFNCNSAQSRN